MQQHRLDMQAHALQASITRPLSGAQATEFESISSLRAQGMECATHRCRKLKMGEVDFNPLRCRILAWNQQASKLRGCHVGLRCMQRSIMAAGLPPGSFDLSLAGALLAQKANMKACQPAKKTHVAARVSWIHALACSRSQEDGKSEDQHIKLLIMIEAQRWQARSVKQTAHKSKSFCTSWIIILDSDGNWVEQTSLEEIEAGCQWENSRCFSQMSLTPFMTCPLLEDFGHLAQGLATASVFDSTRAPPPGMDACARKLSKELKMDPAAPSMKLVFSIEQRRRGWKKAREFAVTGSSGLTFSHFIAATRDPLLTSFDATVANVPHATGHSPPRWQSGTDVIVPKSMASPRVDELRAILLMDPKLDQNNKLLSRSLMSHAEKHSQIPAEQHGSGEKHHAIEAALNEDTLCRTAEQRTYNGFFFRSKKDGRQLWRGPKQDSKCQ